VHWSAHRAFLQATQATIRWVKHILGAFTKLCKATISFVMSVNLSIGLYGATLATTGQIFKKCNTGEFFWIPVNKIQVTLKSDKNNMETYVKVKVKVTL
jgi:hypothetical protein